MKLHPSATFGLAVLILMCTAFAKSKSEEEVFEWKPQSIATFAGMLATFECGRSSGGYVYFFTYSLPSGASVNIDDSTTENQEGGGIKLIESFVVTAELNNTEVTCHAHGATSHSTTAIVRVQQIPVISAGNIRVCQISEKVVFKWLNVFALPGIKVQYKLFLLEEEHTTTENKFYMNYTGLTIQNEGRIAVILTSTAGQITEGNWTNFLYTLNDMKTLSADATLSKRRGMVDFEFIVDLKLSTNDQCSFDTDLEENATMTYCDDSSTAGWACNNNDAMIKYENGKLKCNATLNLLNQKFDSKVSFYYSGQHIETSYVSTSTHEIQNVSITSNNCLKVSLIHGFNISSIHLKLESLNKTIVKNISLSSLCPFDEKKFNISIEKGNWTMFAYDDSTRTKPAFILREVAINLKDVPSSGAVFKATAHLGLAVFFLLLLI